MDDKAALANTPICLLCYVKMFSKTKVSNEVSVRVN